MISVIGDVHGDFDRYKKITERKEYTVQLGDFGFAKEWTKLGYSNIDPNKHKIIPGNHDSYDVCFDTKHCLGHYGQTTLNGVDFYFIRGGYSIDGSIRRLERTRQGKSWWHQEQLSYKQMKQCELDYFLAKPDLVISHTPPHFIIKDIGSPRIMRDHGYDPDFMCRTSEFLNEIFEQHKPKTWIFGHLHTDYCEIISGCTFIGLGILSVIDL